MKSSLVIKLPPMKPNKQIHTRVYMYNFNVGLLFLIPMAMGMAFIIQLLRYSFFLTFNNLIFPLTFLI